MYVNEWRRNWCRDTVWHVPLKFLPSSFHLPFHSRVFSYSISLPVRRFSSPFHSLFSPRFHDDSAVGKIFFDAGTPSPIRPNFTNIRGRINAASLNDDVSGRPPLLHSLRRRCTRTFRANENGYTATTHVHSRLFTFHFISISVIFDGRAIRID